MTTSGITTFNPSRNQIILRAGRQVGAWASGETPSAQEIQDWSDALNSLVKEWEASGLHLWKEIEGILFPVPSQISYTLGPNSTDHASANSTQISLSAAAASGALTITVSSANGIINGQNIGIYLDNTNFFWTTVNGSPIGNVVTLASALTGSSASGNPVHFYTKSLDRPLRILAARRFDQPSLIEVPLIVMSRLDFRDLPNKSATGVVNAIFYDPQLTNGVIWLWPSPTNSNPIIKFTWQQQLQDFNSATDTPDLPQEWGNALTWNLAKEMLVEYGVPEPRGSRIIQRAAESLDLVQGWDREPESLFVGVNFEQSSR